MPEAEKSIPEQERSFFTGLHPGVSLATLSRDGTGAAPGGVTRQAVEVCTGLCTVTQV
jgi:hypothetical protein